MKKPSDPRKVQYPRSKTKKPKRIKGSRKCSECGSYFVPTGVSYEFPVMDEEEVGWVPIKPWSGWVVMTDWEWFKKWKCCPNCGPGGNRRCIGFGGCGDWGAFSGRQLRRETNKNGRRSLCRACCDAQGYLLTWTKDDAVKFLREAVKSIGRMITQDEFHALPNSPGRNALGMLYGAKPWTSLCHDAGLKAWVPGQSRGRRRRFENNVIEENMLLYLSTHDNVAASWKEWRNWSGKTVSATVIARRWDKWTAAWERLGATPCDVIGRQQAGLARARADVRAAKKREDAELIRAASAPGKLLRELESFVGKRITSQKEFFRAQALFNLHKGRETQAAAR